MTLEEYLQQEGRGAVSKIRRATKVSYPTLRRMVRRLPVRLDVAFKVAEFLGCDPRLLAEPRKRRRRVASNRKRGEVRT